MNDNIIQLVSFQECTFRRIVCTACNYQSSEYIAVNIKPENVKCPDCGNAGFLLWWDSMDRDSY